jgi:predicted AAA+ superfamily ATPase
MTLEEKNSIKMKKKKKQVKKTLPKNVFEIVGESGELVERVDSNKTNKIEKKVEKSQETEPKPTFSERTTKRRVNKKFYQI